MRYKYVGILCGADESIVDLKYEDIEFEREILEKEEIKRKYGLDPSSGIYIDGAYTWIERNRFEIIKIVIKKEKKELDDEELNLDSEIEQHMHKQIDFFISSINMLTDGFLYVICPMIYVENLTREISAPYGFPYELPNSIFRGYSDNLKEKKYLSEYDHNYLIEKLDLIKSSNIFKAVKDYYNHYKWTYNISVQFLLLMVCLEVLLVNTNEGMTHRISRNVAVLFSKNREDGISIYKRMKNLYDIRSRIVHDGVYDCTKFEKKYQGHPLFELKKIVYNVIQLYLDRNFDKDLLIEELETIGYGDFNIK